MNIDRIKNIGTSAVGVVIKTAKRTSQTVKHSFDNPVAKKSFKKSLPVACATAGALSLFSLIPNRKADGKQTKIEKKSGTLASVIFALASFKKFFNVEGQKVKDIFSKLKLMKVDEVWDIVKAKKANAVLYIATILGVKIVTDVVTKGIDAFVNEITDPKKLGD